MLGEMSLWIWLGAIVVFALGGAAGYIAARQTRNQRTRRLEEELNQTRLDLSVYRGQVERHFLKTSELFGKLTGNYREVYEHLSHGAQTLCKERPTLSSLNLPRNTILPETRTGVARESPSTSRQAATLPEAYSSKAPNLYGADEDEALRNEAFTPAIEEIAEPEAAQIAAASEIESAAGTEARAEAESATEIEAEEAEIEEVHLGVESASNIDFTRPTNQRKTPSSFH